MTEQATHAAFVCIGRCDCAVNAGKNGQILWKTNTALNAGADVFPRFIANGGYFVGRDADDVPV